MVGKWVDGVGATGAGLDKGTAPLNTTKWTGIIDLGLNFYLFIFFLLRQALLCIKV